MQQCREDVHEDSSYQPAIYHRQILHWNLSHRHQDSSQDYTENVYDLQLVDIPSRSFLKAQMLEIFKENSSKLRETHTC
jgi:hypothetical protein